MSSVIIAKSELKHCEDHSMSLTMILMYVFVFAILAVVIVILIFCYKKKKSVKVDSVAKDPQINTNNFEKDSDPRDNTDYYYEDIEMYNTDYDEENIYSNKQKK